MLIRDALVSDLPGVTECLRGLSHVWLTPDGVEEVFSRKIRLGHVLLVAEEGGRVVGTACLVPEPKFLRGGLACRLEEVAVAPSSRGAGVGRALVAEALARSRAMGAYKTTLDCSEENVGFYLRCGLARGGASMRAGL